MTGPKSLSLIELLIAVVIIGIVGGQRDRGQVRQRGRLGTAVRSVLAAGAGLSGIQAG